MPDAKVILDEQSFTQDKVTKGSVRYHEDSDDPVVGSIYIRKAALGPDWPETITVTVVGH